MNRLPLRLVAGVTFAFAGAAHAGPTPASVMDILPPLGKIHQERWLANASATTGTLHADLAGATGACDPATRIDLRVDIRGDNAARGPGLQQMERALENDQADARRKLGALAKKRKKSGGDQVVSVGEVKEEAVAGGMLATVEYVENCAQFPNRTLTILKGYARNGALFLRFDASLIGGAAQARAMAGELIGKFAKLDTRSPLR